jgi:hypothetical protein
MTSTNQREVQRIDLDGVGGQGDASSSLPREGNPVSTVQEPGGRSGRVRGSNPGLSRSKSVFRPNFRGINISHKLIQVLSRRRGIEVGCQLRGRPKGGGAPALDLGKGLKRARRKQEPFTKYHNSTYFLGRHKQ